MQNIYIDVGIFLIKKICCNFYIYINEKLLFSIRVNKLITISYIIYKL